MRNPAATVILGLLLALLNVQIARASTFTYQLLATEKACFHTTAETIGEKIAFYFAVQKGGNFDIDYRVQNPDGTTQLSGTSERQGDFVFSAKQIGEYTFCFFNGQSSHDAKNIDFEISAEHEQAELAERLKNPFRKDSSSGVPDAGKEQFQIILQVSEEHLGKVSGQLAEIGRLQRHFRTRENRNFATVTSTETRIFWFAVSESALMVVMGLLQVFVIRTFFSKGGRIRV